MRYLLAFLLALAMACPAVSQVTQLEYFMDTDPGYGMATAIPVTTCTDVFKTYTLPLSSVSEGFHIVSFRAKDAQGHWSHITSHTLYVLPGVAASVTTSEYYIDTDPGYGNAISVPGTVGSDSSLKFIVPLSSYTTGFHTIGLRSKDDQGRWSHTYQHAFYVSGNNTAVNITALQYYFVADTTVSEMYTYPVPVPSVNVDLNFTADLSKLPGDKLYDMHIWAVNVEGTRSEVLIKKVKVCSGAVAKAKFDFIPLGTQISFIDSSKGASRYRWDFGDGKIDSVSNPMHNYAIGGNYKVKLIVSNFCNSDTIVKQVNALSLQSLFPSKGGNTGNVTVTILGGGFTNETVVKLTKGSIQINGVNSSISKDGKLLYTTFELNNEELGMWDLKTETNSNKLILTNAFKVETTILPSITLDIEGRDEIRRNTAQKYKLVFNNTGNVDAKVVPFWLGVANNSMIKFTEPILQHKNDVFDTDTIPIFITVDTLLSQPLNETTDIYPLVLSKVPANASTQYEIEVTTVSLSSTTELKAWSFASLKNPELDPNFKDCLIESVKEQLKDEVLDIACMNDLFESMEILDKNPCQTPQQWVDADNRYGNLPEREKKIANFCDELNAKSPLLMQSAYLPAFFSAFAIGCVKTKTLAIGKKAIIEHITEDFKKQIALEVGVFSAETAKKSYDKCKSVYSRISSYFKKHLQILVSRDPNEKVGTKGNTMENFVQGKSPFNYKIFFENQNTATAFAREVNIIDTLDLHRFDLSTLQLRTFGFGDSTSVTVPIGLQAYSSTTLLHRPGKTDLTVRVDAKLDTATGILKWRIISLDPTTRELINDPLDGFLPPNKRSPEGEGYVSYSIMPKADLPHRSEIRNKAAIYFDNNDPIITNEFLNTIDKVKPASKVSTLPVETYDTTFTVKWSGTDQDAGIRSYDIYYAINNGPFQLWQYDVSTDSSIFTGKYDSTYRFYSIAKDYAGNIETPKIVGETYTHITGSALPISLLSFNAHIAGNNTILNWVTASEQNSSYFNLERSTDGVNFTTIATIKAAGSSNTSLNYGYVDSNVVRLHTDEIYYRLQQVDKNGKYKFTPIIKVSVVNQVFTVSILPNPVLDYVNLQIAVDKVQPIDILITDASGRTLINDKKSMMAGTNSKSYNTASWSTGIYIIRITKADGTSKTFRIVKQ